MRPIALAGTMAVVVTMAAALTTPAQDLCPTPEGRLGGREPLPTPPIVAPSPSPPPLLATAVPTATPVTAGIATPAIASSPATAVEPGALEGARASTVTVLAWRGDAAILGSGWAFDAEGRVVTAASLVATSDRVEVVAADGRRQAATVLGSDPLSGIAVLEARELGLPPLSAGGPAAAGLDVVAIGTADGRFPGTLVAGLVSSERRSLPERYPTTPLILMAMEMPDGMAGGPLVDRATGEAIGSVVPGPGPAVPRFGPSDIDGPEATALASGGSGLGFAVPVATVERITAALIDRGRIDYPFLGAALESVTPAVASRLGLETVGGAIVREVVAGGPADRAGVEPGDAIVRFAGEALGPDLPVAVALAAREPGEEVVLDLLRNGDRLEVVVVLGERQPVP